MVRLRQIIDNRRAGRLVLIILAMAAIVAFVLISNSLVKDLAKQERERMDIWAQATEKLALAQPDEDIEFLLSIISQNNSIPVMVTDTAFNILQFRNFNFPEAVSADTYTYEQLSPANQQWIDRELRAAAGNRPLAEVAAGNDHFIPLRVGIEIQYIYYEDSILLRRLSYYPYVQLVVMILLVVILYSAVVYSKRAEQNRVWVGLSKETAHQLGTPISSLMAWTDLLRLSEGDADATAEAVCADGGKFREYLDVQAAFRNYSATNALLILATKPDARRLGDKDFWRDQGVYIKRQEFGHPIKIVESNGEYTRDDGSIGVSYNIKRVYDISQTTSRMRTPQAVSHDARALLNALIYKRPAPVQSVDELPNGMDAVYDREQNAVFVRRGLSAIDLFCGLSKALAQAELARTGEEYTEENAGFKAQCVSYILGKEFGVDVSGYAFEAPADFLRTDDPQTIRAELTDIRDTAYDISARMMRSLEQSKAPRQSEQER